MLSKTTLLGSTSRLLGECQFGFYIPLFDIECLNDLSTSNWAGRSKIILSVFFEVCWAYYEDNTVPWLQCGWNNDWSQQLEIKMAEDETLSWNVDLEVSLFHAMRRHKPVGECEVYIHVVYVSYRLSNVLIVVSILHGRGECRPFAYYRSHGVCFQKLLFFMVLPSFTLPIA